VTRQGTQCEDDTGILSNADFAAWLRDRIGRRSAAAVVRFGDSEDSLLMADPGDASSMKLAAGKLAKETGEQFSYDAILEIGRGMSRAFDEADVLGIVGKDGLVRGLESRLPKLYRERVAAGRPPVALASPHLHHSILETLPSMLAGRRVSAITCRDVKPVLEADWRLEDVVVHQVPSQHLLRHVDGAYEAALHDTPFWPDVHSQLRDELTVRERGEIFLVGAGPFGKDLCIDIRERGGLALDLGSALDRIVGKITRGVPRWVRLWHANGLSTADIVNRLEEQTGVKIDYDKIAELVQSDAPDWVDNPFNLDLFASTAAARRSAKRLD